MTPRERDPAREALNRAFVGVGYVVGARGAELEARSVLDDSAKRIATLLESGTRDQRARRIAWAVLDVGRDLDKRRIE